jgi:hypothetical protein
MRLLDALIPLVFVFFRQLRLTLQDGMTRTLLFGTLLAKRELTVSMPIALQPFRNVSFKSLPRGLLRVVLRTSQLLKGLVPFPLVWLLVL